MRVAHLTFDLGAWYKRRHRVNDHHIDGVTAHQRVYNLQRLLTRVRLGNQQILGVNAAVCGIRAVHRVFSVNKGCIATRPLGTGNDVLAERRLTRSLGAIDLRNTPSRYTPHAQRQV